MTGLFTGVWMNPQGSVGDRVVYCEWRNPQGSVGDFPVVYG